MIASAARLFAVLCAATLLSLVSGCASLNSMLENKPTASVKGVKLQGLTLEQATLVFDVEIGNPYSVPLPLVDLDYGLTTSDQSFLSGKANIGGTVPAHGSKVVSLPAGVVFTKLLAAAQGVKPGSVVPYTADMKMSVDAPGVGPLSLPMQKKGEVPVPTVPDVEVTSLQWKNLTLTDASAVMNVRVKNTNDFNVDLNKMGYKLALGGTEVATTNLANAASLSGKGGEKTLEIPLSFSPAKFGVGLFNILRGKGAAYDLSGTINAGTPFGALDMPYKKSGQTIFK